jgi:hypothetical protein
MAAFGPATSQTQDSGSDYLPAWFYRHENTSGQVALFEQGAQQPVEIDDTSPRSALAQREPAQDDT